MQVIVIGCGKVGSKFAQTLYEEGHDVVIVDNDPNSFRLLDKSFNGVTITGVPIDKEVLKSAGIETADAIAAVTPDDNVNIMVSQVAKEIFKVPKVLARIYNPAREQVFHEFGLETVCPTNITADVIQSIILEKAGVSRHTIGNMFFSFNLQQINTSLDGKKVGTIKLKKDSAVFGIVRDKKFMFANINFKLKKGDTLIISERVD